MRGVAPGSGPRRLSGVDEDDGQIRKRGADGHVARVFFMTRRVGDDEAAVIRIKVAVGDVDGDALFPFGHEPVEEERIVDGTAAAADFTFKLQGPLLVGVEQFGIVQQVADERRFAVVDTAAGDEF